MPRTSPRPSRVLMALLTTLAVALGVVVLPPSAAQARAVTPTLTAALQRPNPAPDGTAFVSARFGVFHDTLGPAIREDTFRVRGRLTSGDVGVPGKELVLLRRLDSEEDYTPVATAEPVVTDEQGWYDVAQPVVGTASYAVRLVGDGVEYSTATSPIRRLRAVRDFNAGQRKVDGRLYFRGVVRPSWSNRTVTLQRKACGTCAWRTVTSRRTGAQGGWSFRVSYPRRVGPVWRWQAVLAAAGDFERSYSAVLTTRRVYTR